MMRSWKRGLFLSYLLGFVGALLSGFVAWCVGYGVFDYYPAMH
jgi:uncharacterized membrane protein YeaQ/YmgE (transglycosylase-associated protein family)